MKSQQTVILFFCILCIAGCKKEQTAQQINSVSQQNGQTNQTKGCPVIDPSNFVKEANNPYFPLVTGTSFHYVNRIIESKRLSLEHVDVTVTSDTKKILGVACTVVHDVVKQKGEVTEDTYDWYAQDKQGNLWYFGEDTKARTDTGWSTEGSWEAGVDGACAGIAMWAKPENHIGEMYYQEFLKGIAEDQAEVVNTNVDVKVPYGTFSHCIKTKEFTRLEPGVIEFKYYAAGVGQLKTEMTKGGNELEELISLNH